MTVDAFTLAPVQSESQGLTPVPTLTADLSVTTYLTPADQGLTGGATPTGPAPATATPASTTHPRSGRDHRQLAPNVHARLDRRADHHAMKKIHTPRLLSNLYRDMRDRRMLMPAIALVVALIAVPFVLGKSSSSRTAVWPRPRPRAATVRPLSSRPC